MRKSKLLRLAMSLLFVILATGASRGAEGTDAERLATRFAKLFLAGEDDEARGLMAPQMAAALTSQQAGQLRVQLGGNGAVVEIGEAWHEDTVQGFERFRVPVRFEQATLDLQVVIDGELQIAGMFFKAHHERPSGVLELAPVKETDVRVGDAETGLPGTISIPAGEGPFPAVVLVHGSGANDRDETVGPNKPLRDLAWGLAERGVLTLRYDKRSFARPEDLAPIGEELTVAHEVIDDARIALALLRARDDVARDQVYVVGHSLGGALAPRIASSPPRPAGIVVLAGIALPLPERMLEQTRYIVSLDGRITPEEQAQLDQVEAAVTTIREGLQADERPAAGFILGAPLGYYADLESHDSPAIAKQLGLPILVIQGERDYQVTVEGDFALWRKALGKASGACLKVYGGLDHLFRKGTGPSNPDDYMQRAPFNERVIDDIAGWILKRACPSAPRS